MRFPTNIIIGMISPERNWALKLALYSSSFSDLERLLNLTLAAEHLDQRMTRESFLDPSVERPGPPPLADELLLGPLHDHTRQGASRSGW